MKIFFYRALLFALILVNQHLFAQSSADIYTKIKKLNVVGSVLYIAAHPDDENTRLLSYLSNELQVRTAYLSLTRGDGGQNLIGTEQGEKLGIIRTEELLAARRIDGAEQYFTRAYDFGFSKGPEETLEKWERDSILRDVVWVIRTLQPDVIITRFPTDGSGGHGHHTSSAIIAEEAFVAAADPNKFPDQLKYVSTWKAKRLVWNGFNFGNRPQSDGKGFSKLEIGQFNPMLGKSYGEIASESRSQHKSQGFGVPMQRGSSVETFKWVAGDTVQKNIFDGIDFSWNRISGSKKIQSQIDIILKNYSVQDPSAQIENLLKLHNEISSIKNEYWRNYKLQEVQQIIEQSLGLFIGAYSSDYKYSRNDTMQYTLQIINRSSVPVTLVSVTDPGQHDTTWNKVLGSNILLNYTSKIAIPAAYPFSNTHWLQHPQANNMFDVPNPSLRAAATSNANFLCKIKIQVGDKTFTIERPIQYKWTDPVRGELKRKVLIQPSASFQVSSSTLLLKNNNHLQLRIVAHRDKTSGIVQFEENGKYSVSPSSESFNIEKEGQEILLDFIVNTKGELEASDRLYPFLKIGNEKINFYQREINYEHIPIHHYSEHQSVKVINEEIKIKGKKAGYIQGAGDEIPQAVKLLGYEVVLLDDNTLGSYDLSSLDCIVAGIRLYNTQAHMVKHQQRLMDYVFKGGNYIVQYNTNNFISSIPVEMGPYPFKIGRDRVTEENAMMKQVIPNHPFLREPNIIREEDFNYWVQERGLYFATNIDSKYEKLFSVADKGEKPSDGILISAKYGKGRFTYTGMAFFRQLPAGVPGAYKLFANILSSEK